MRKVPPPDQQALSLSFGRFADGSLNLIFARPLAQKALAL
jgi:hypothetical protein